MFLWSVILQVTKFISQLQEMMKTHEGFVIHELNNKNIFKITYVSKYNKLYHAY